MREPSISNYLSERIEAGDFPSSVYIVSQSGSPVFSDALGNAVCEPEFHSTTLDTIYDLASLTKPLVTGLLYSILIEKGEIGVDDRVSRYIAEFKNEDKREIRISQLLTHSSGLPAWRPLYILTGGNPEQTRKVISEQPLEYSPGTRVVYSDLGFIMLGFIVESLTGKNISDLANSLIFTPLGLKKSFFRPDKSYLSGIAASEILGNTYEKIMCREMDEARAYQNWREGIVWGEVHDGNAYFLGGASGHAGLFSTAKETLRIADQFIAETSELLKKESCKLFSENQTAGLEEARSLAWQLAATPNSTAGPDLPPESFGHTGFTGTSCWIDPAKARIFILLTNRTHCRNAEFVNINGVRRHFHSLAYRALNQLDSD
jgi:serine-type D-Ala-D-Ala carboxypeptidase